MWCRKHWSVSLKFHRIATAKIWRRLRVSCMLILIHDLTVLRSNTHLIFIIAYDRRWMRERLVRQTQHSIRIDGFWHRRWDQLLPRHRWWFLFFLFSPLSSSSLSFEFRVLETRVACTLELGSVDSFTATGAFLCRTIHWRVEDHVDIPKILPDFGKKLTRESESKQKAMRLVSLTHWQTGSK